MCLLLGQRYLLGTGSATMFTIPRAVIWYAVEAIGPAMSTGIRKNETLNSPTSFPIYHSQTSLEGATSWKRSWNYGYVVALKG